jgi:heptose I phosphotransferase
VYLDKALTKYFPETSRIFEQMMALRGECFRHLEGRVTQRLALGEKYYFIKQHRGVGWKEIFKNLFQGRLPVLSAKNEWQAIEKLQALNIAAPKVVAYGRRGMNPARQQSFVLMEELAPVISLEDLCKIWQHTPPAPKFKHQLIEEVAKIARGLHQNGINHRDFYICHFLLDITLILDLALNPHTHSQPPFIKLYLIDLHRAQIRRLTPERWIIKDLAGLYFSSKDIGLTQRDLYRFIKVYTARPLRETFKHTQIFWEKVKARGEQLYSSHTKQSFC